MSTFALDVGSSNADIVTAINYAISNLGTGITTSGNVGANVVYVNTTTGQITSNSSGTIGYLYGFVNVKYANSATGSSGFSSNCRLSNYYGVHNTTDGSISSNPVDYNWFQVTGGFGTTKGLYYQNVGGYQAKFSANAVAPNQYYTPVKDNTAIALLTLAPSIVTSNTIQSGAVTNVSIASNTIQGNNIQSGTITGNLIAANTIVGNNIQAGTITATNIAAGTITTDKLAANVLVANTIVSTGATIEVPTGTGFWFDGNTGNAYMGGNTTIGTNLRVGNNAVIGGFATIGSNVSIGGNLNVGGLITAGNLLANTVTTTTLSLNTVSLGNGVSSSTSQVISSPVGSFIYTYTYAQPIITTTVVNEGVYINGQYSMIVNFAPSSGTLYQMFGYIYNETLGYGVGGGPQCWYFNTYNTGNINFAFNANFTGYDTPQAYVGGPPGTYKYSMKFVITSGFTSGVNSLTFLGGSMVLQGMKR